MTTTTTKVARHYNNSSDNIKTDNSVTFRAWLSQFRKDDTALGDLARDVAEDRSFPTLKAVINGDGAKGHRYLRNARDASDAAMDAYKEAWYQYKHGCSYHQYLVRVKKENPNLVVGSRLNDYELAKIVDKYYYDEKWK